MWPASNPMISSSRSLATFLPNNKPASPPALVPDDVTRK